MSVTILPTNEPIEFCTLRRYIWVWDLGYFLIFKSSFPPTLKEFRGHTDIYMLLSSCPPKNPRQYFNNDFMGAEIIDKNFICFVFVEYYFLFLQTTKRFYWRIWKRIIVFINSVAKTRLMKKRTGETVKTNSCQYNDFYIRGYYDRGKIVLLTWTKLIG